MSFLIYPQELFKSQRSIFLYDLDNENEGNEFIAVVDRKAVNVIDDVDEVTAEKADKSTEENKQRFVNQSNAPIDV